MNFQVHILTSTPAAKSTNDILARSNQEKLLLAQLPRLIRAEFAPFRLACTGPYTRSVSGEVTSQMSPLCHRTYLYESGWYCKIYIFSL